MVCCVYIYISYCRGLILFCLVVVSNGDMNIHVLKLEMRAALIYELITIVANFVELTPAQLSHFCNYQFFTIWFPIFWVFATCAHCLVFIKCPQHFWMLFFIGSVSLMRLWIFSWVYSNSVLLLGSWEKHCAGITRETQCWYWDHEKNSVLVLGSWEKHCLGSWEKHCAGVMRETLCWDHEKRAGAGIMRETLAGTGIIRETLCWYWDHEKNIVLVLG